MTTYRTTFMSHTHVDNPYCADLRARLHALGIDAWIDLSNMQDGHSLSNDITFELFQRQAFVALLTSASNASHWVGQELETYLNFANDRRYRLVGGIERLIVPVLLEADLPMVVRDSETQRDRASNWAKLFRLKAIDAVGRNPQQVAQEIARALEIVAQPSLSPVPPSPPQWGGAGGGATWDDIAIPARLDSLGFAGYRDRTTGVAFIIPSVCQVPAGKFTMGSAQNDPEAYDAEKPQYSIPVAAFEIGQYPVTVAEYALAVQAGVVPEPPDTIFTVPAPWRDKILTWTIQQQRAEHPVVCVTWENAQDYCRWLAQVTGQPWRLPTEAEWEKATRWDASRTPPHARIYPWGDQWDKARANTADGGPGMTTPIGMYVIQGDASPYGCHDMAGNVWEWTSTMWYNAPPYDYFNHEGDINNNSGNDKARVLRGGSWDDDPRHARAACRYWYDREDVWNVYRGFRVARGADVTDSS